MLQKSLVKMYNHSKTQQRLLGALKEKATPSLLAAVECRTGGKMGRDSNICLPETCAMVCSCMQMWMQPDFLSNIEMKRSPRRNPGQYWGKIYCEIVFSKTFNGENNFWKYVLGNSDEYKRIHKDFGPIVKEAQYARTHWGHNTLNGFYRGEWCNPFTWKVHL